MVHRSEGVSFELIPMHSNGIKLKEETWRSLLGSLANLLLQLPASSGSLSGGLFLFLLVRVESIPSYHPLNVAGRDPFAMPFLVKHP